MNPTVRWRLTRARSHMSFAGNYEDDARCVWTIECQAEGVHPQLSFEAFETEEAYECVSARSVASLRLPRCCALHAVFVQST